VHGGRRPGLANRDDVRAALTFDLEDLPANPFVRDGVLGLAAIADEFHSGFGARLPLARSRERYHFSVMITIAATPIAMSTAMIAQLTGRDGGGAVCTGG
jgi:hypothetical protein